MSGTEVSVPKILRCAIYTRKSGAEKMDRDFGSIESQRALCAAHIFSQSEAGWSLIDKRYDDEGFSGGNLKRPAVKELMSDASSGGIDIIVVYKIDRMSRSLRDFLDMIAVLDANNVAFVSVTQSFSTASPMGRLTLNVLLSFAQFEREVIGERLRDWFAGARERGIWTTRRPFGYQLDKDRRLIVDPAEADLVKHIFQRYAKLRSARLIAAELNRAGLKTYLGNFFSTNQITRVLQNRLFIGERVCRGRVQPGFHEPIITRRLFDKTQELIEHNGRYKKRHCRATRTGMLNGIIFTTNGYKCVHAWVKGRGRVFRYYLSDSDPQVSLRLVAEQIEEHMLSLVWKMTGGEPYRSDDRLGRGEGLIRGIIERIEVGSSEMAVVLKSGARLHGPLIGRAAPRKPKYTLRTPPEWLDDAYQLLDEGLDWSSIARRLGVDVGSFHSIFPRFLAERHLPIASNANRMSGSRSSRGSSS